MKYYEALRGPYYFGATAIKRLLSGSGIGSLQSCTRSMGGAAAYQEDKKGAEKERNNHEQSSVDSYA